MNANKLILILFLLPCFLKAQWVYVKVDANRVYQMDKGIQLKEMTAPTTPPSTYGHLFEKTDNRLYFLNDAGTEYLLTPGAGAGTVTSVGTTSPVLGGTITTSGTISLAGLTTLGTAGQMTRTNAGATGWEYFTPSFGTVTSFSATDGNGFDFTVVNPTTTPTLTATTTVSDKRIFYSATGALSGSVNLTFDDVATLFNAGDVTNSRYLEMDGGNRLFTLYDVTPQFQISPTNGISLYKGVAPAVDYFLVGNGTYADFVSPTTAKNQLAITSADISNFNEASQDAIGLMVDASLNYVDATPLLQRAALTGDVTATAGSNTTAIAAGVIVDADINAAANITATKLGTGAVDNTELNYISTATGTTGTATTNLVYSTSPVLTTPNIGTFTAASGTMSGKMTTYNGIVTANNGLLSSVGTPVNLTAQAAAIAATTCYTTTTDGFYQVNWQAAITTAATTSSTLGHFQVRYTNVADNVVKTTPTQNNVTASAANATTGTGSSINGTFTVYAKSGTAIQYIMGYASSGATAMLYSLDITVVKL